jgi:hypothetical protein
MPGPSLRVLSDSLLRPLSPNHQSRSVPVEAVVGPSWTLIYRGRIRPDIRPHKNIFKTGKLVNCLSLGSFCETSPLGGKG